MSTDRIALDPRRRAHHIQDNNRMRATHTPIGPNSTAGPGIFRSPHPLGTRIHSFNQAGLLSSVLLAQANAASHPLAQETPRPAQVAGESHWIEYTGQKLMLWSGKFQDRSRPHSLECKASSGFKLYGEDHQSAQLQDQVLGPVPEGHYRVNLSLNPHRWASILLPTKELAAAEGVQRIRESYRGPNGEPLIPTGWGTWRARLDPVKLKIKTTRHNFYLHNSKKGFTHGCIETCDALYNIFVQYHNEGVTAIDVLVNYTTQSTYGGTDE